MVYSVLVSRPTLCIRVHTECLLSMKLGYNRISRGLIIPHEEDINKDRSRRENVMKSYKNEEKIL